MEQHLRRLLDELSAAIGRSRGGDREELTQLHSDVADRLAGDGPPAKHGLVETLERAETRFESDHPALAQSIRQALQVLSSSGI